MSDLIQQEWQSLAPSGVKVRYFLECGSTNNLATEYAAKGFIEPTWFVASRQTQGRGRRGRAWASEQGNLYCSLLTKLDVPMSDLATLPYLVSLAVRDTFIGLGCAPDAVSCKWPNDVLINEKKASGILIESAAGETSRLDYVVIGIGLNLAHYPDDTLFPATSVVLETGKEATNSTAFRFLADCLNERLSKWTPPTIAGLVEEWTKASWGLGKRREIRTADETFHATLVGLDETGGLKLLLDDGSQRSLYAGDVFGTTRQGGSEVD